MRLFVPAIGYRIKLVSDWSFQLYPEHRNKTLFEALSGKEMPRVYRGWHKTCDDDKQWNEAILDATLEAETVLEVDRVYVRAANKLAQSSDDDFDSLTFKVIKHPTLKGTQRQLRFWAKLEDVNKIKYELPPDHTAGKDQAREHAKKPKKLSPLFIKQLVSNAVHSYNDVEPKSYHGDVPKWLSVDVVKQLSAVAEEYRRLRMSWERAQHDLNAKLQLDDLERRFLQGKVEVPLACANKVQSFSDFLHYVPSASRAFNENASWYHWSYIITNNIMRSHDGTSCVFSRLSDGTRCRTFRPNKPHDPSAPDVTHVWVKVYSDVGDLEIIKLEAGFDGQA